MGIVTVIIISILIAVILTAVLFIFRNLTTPSKIDGISKLLKEGKYTQAQKASKAMISKDQRNYLAHYYLGKAYLLDNKPELAFMEYKTVNQNALFNGEIPEAEFRKEIAELYLKFNQQQAALNEFLLLTKMEPRVASHNFEAAKIYEEMGNYKLAMGFYQKTIMLDKKNPKAYTYISRVLIRAKNYKQAKQALESAVRLSPDNYENYYYLGKIAKEEKDLSTAVKLFEKSERSPELKLKAIVEKSMCLMQANQYDRAIDGFLRAIDNATNQKANDVLYARYFLGMCYEKNRKIEKALEQWETVFNINNKFKDVAAKLNQYKELETNDGIKEFLTSSNQQFVEICKKIALAGFNLAAQKVEITPYGCQMLATENKKETWMNAKQQIYFAQFYRSTDVIEEEKVRKLADMIKTKNYVSGYLFASSDFAPAAFTYSENRPIVLVPKDKLAELFKKAGM